MICSKYYNGEAKLTQYKICIIYFTCRNARAADSDASD